MGRIGFAEILVIGVLVLVVFGPQRLPEIARQIGRALGEIRKVSSQFQQEVRGGFGLDDDDNFPYMYGPVNSPAPPSRRTGELPANDRSATSDDDRQRSRPGRASGTEAGGNPAELPAEVPWAPWPGERGDGDPAGRSTTEPT